MSKVIQAILSGMFFTFILDFFLFLGIKLHYIDANEIDLYYNILFADNQNIYIFLFFTALLGYVTLYLSNKISIILLGTLFVLTFSTLIAPIGALSGELLLMEKNKTLETHKFIYRGDVYYTGRKAVYFYDRKLETLLKIEKKNIKELY
ncbi:MAG: hypothetical protein JXQ67_08875 [Campylobacterales bacterium]|nr:hypothetical protein [Campylobacterales bacterium]